MTSGFGDTLAPRIDAVSVYGVNSASELRRASTATSHTPAVGSAAVRPPLRPLEEEERERVLAAAQGELSTSITSPPSAPT